ncbi:NAD(P)H-quinone oxidoreductase [Congregibacter litoralis]|uniref:Putative NAD(P)H quinone oxidoreductase, PIG3 family n=1 Tax=Congregibacter litoralis KT71 TaxID=314285 RepID=A4AC60_9GAMM|nr:NAD(P)H-quinone oxidoreductase [Congregibacter litoralis]EAQ96510.2 putative NAD(P)H quinone oxidoreductase, PIG3 family [Congregibacter litoralis KT71]
MTDITRRFVHIDESDRSLSLQEDQAPVPGADEVLIEVAAAGLNRADLLQWKGLYPPPPDASPIMGLEVAGTVVACGEAVNEFRPGDEVCALTHGGGYASHAIAPRGQTLAVPAAFELHEAAALPEALLTVWHNVFQRAGLKAGENVLIHGGASGIGTLGVGICKAMGATVFSTAGSEEKCRRVEALGASKAFNYKKEDFVEGLDALGLKGRIAVILDMVGGDYIERNFEVAAPEGRIVNIAFLRGFKADVNFLPLLLKRLTLTGSTLRAQSETQKAQMVREIREELFEHLDKGSIQAVIDREFPLAQAQEALEYMESGVHMGKILLRP